MSVTATSPSKQPQNPAWVLRVLQQSLHPSNRKLPTRCTIRCAFYGEGHLALTDCGDTYAVVQRVALVGHSSGARPEEGLPSSCLFRYYEHG